MYQDFFSLNQHPFAIAPDADFLFFTEQHKEALAHLTYGLQGNGGFVVLTGEVGTGKTSVCQFLLQELPEDTDIASITNPAVSEIDLLVEICEQFSISYDNKNISLKVMFDALASWMLLNQQGGRHAIVLIDEAQHLSFNVLEQLRLITNIEADNLKPLQIILIGQSSLQKKLLSNELRQLSQRITARYHLRVLNKQESEFYIHHRLNKAGAKMPIFDEKSSIAIFKASLGIPLLINQICDRCLLMAYTKSSITITRPLAKKVINEMELPKKECVLKAYIPHSIALIAVLLTAFIINIQSTSIKHYINPPETGSMQDEWLALIHVADAQTITVKTKKEILTLTSINTLQAIPSNHFSLQLVALANKKLLQQFFVRYPLFQENSYLYQSAHSEQSQYVVLFGNFESYKKAKLASKVLTNQFPKITPWIRDYRTIQNDMR